MAPVVDLSGDIIISNRTNLLALRSNEALQLLELRRLVKPSRDCILLIEGRRNNNILYCAGECQVFGNVLCHRERERERE